MKRTKIYSIALALLLGASLTFANTSVEVKKEMTREEVVAAFKKKGITVKFTNNVDYTAYVEGCCGHPGVTLTSSSASGWYSGACSLQARWCGIE
jgi:hypothetical protein